MSDVRTWLEVSAEWRAAAILFASPRPEGREELLRLADTLSPAGRQMIQSFGSASLDGWESEYHRVLGPAGCPACESSYEENVLAGRGPVLAGIAAFYEAFSYRPDPAAGETPDHLSIELGFLSYMALKIAFGLHEGRRADTEVARDAYAKFLAEHPGYWFGRFSEQLAGYESELFAPAVLWAGQRLGAAAGGSSPREAVARP